MKNFISDIILFDQKASLDDMQFPWEMISNISNLFKNQSSAFKNYENVIINNDNGPVIIDDSATIQPFSVLNGPLFIGKNCLIDDSFLPTGKAREPLNKPHISLASPLFSGLGELLKAEWFSVKKVTAREKRGGPSGRGLERPSASLNFLLRTTAISGKICRASERSRSRTTAWKQKVERSTMPEPRDIWGLFRSSLG